MTNQAISSVLDYFYLEALMASGLPGAHPLLRSIEDMRDLLSRAPLPPAAIEEFDMIPFADGIVEILNLASEQRAKRVVLVCQPQSLLVTQDRKALEQLVARVLDSAIKLQAGPKPVSLRIAGTASWIKLGVTMNEAALGVRLAHWLNADLERAPFPTPGEVPVGLALMVAGKRLRAMGGAASLDEDSGVSLGLPSCTSIATPKGHVDALNILVAEDNDESFVLTEMVLQEERVWRARDGQDALEMLQKQRFDLIFMDVHMPGMNGYEAIKNMRDWETRTGAARTPMVVLSSDDLETQQRSAAEFGCSGYLRKPLQKWDLIPLLKRLK